VGKKATMRRQARIKAAFFEGLGKPVPKRDTSAQVEEWLRRNRRPVVRFRGASGVTRELTWGEEWLERRLQVDRDVLRRAAWEYAKARVAKSKEPLPLPGVDYP
jgi:hypothetical protein